MTTPLIVWGHEAAVIGYLVFALIVAARSSRTLLAAFFLTVMLATAAWAQSFVAVYLGYAPVWLEGVMSTLRDGVWLGIALALMQRHAKDTNYFRALTVVAVVLVALQILLGMGDLMVGVFAASYPDDANVRFDLIHRPLSDLFVVYNEQQLTDQLTPVNTGRGLIVKYTHMLAF